MPKHEGATFWVVDMKPTPNSTLADVVYSTNPKQFALMVAGGLDADSVQTFDYEPEALDAAMEALEDYARRFHALALEAERRQNAIEREGETTADAPAVEVCEACARHYGDGGVCDQGKPAASPHRAITK